MQFACMSAPLKNPVFIVVEDRGMYVRMLRSEVETRVKEGPLYVLYACRIALCAAVLLQPANPV